MSNEKIFEDVLHSVSDVTGLSSKEILYNRNEECTDARYLLVKYLWRLMSCVCIGKMIGRTRQGVRSIMERTKGDTWLMERNWEEIVKQMKSKGYESK